MNCLRNSRSSALPRLLLHRHRPTQLPTPRCNHLIHTAARRSRPETLDSARRLFFRHVDAYRRPSMLLMPLRSYISQNPPPVRLARRWYTNTREVAKVVLLLCGMGVLNSCASVLAIVPMVSHLEIVPYTNRVHWIISSSLPNEREMENLGFKRVKKELGDKVLGCSDVETIRVRLIPDDIIRSLPITRTSIDDGVRSSSNVVRSVTSDMWATKSQKQGEASVQPHTEHLRDLDWEVIVVRDNHVYICVKPGGKIVVHAGLLNYLKTDAEIATMIAHEVGHVVARHSKEFTRKIESILLLYKLLPFSRRNEMEADLIGMMLMAAAGYDPRVAPRVYQKLGEIIGNSAWRNYIGTHPSGTKRSRLLSKGNVMEEALKLYEK